MELVHSPSNLHRSYTHHNTTRKTTGEDDTTRKTTREEDSGADAYLDHWMLVVTQGLQTLHSTRV